VTKSIEYADRLVNDVRDASMIFLADQNRRLRNENEILKKELDKFREIYRGREK